MSTVDNQGVLFYEVTHDYTPSDEDCQQGYLAIQKGDVLEMDTPDSMEAFEGTLENPTGWLTGRNQRTGVQGHFPGNYVQYLKTPPPLPPKPRFGKTQPQEEQVNDSGYGGSPVGK